MDGVGRGSESIMSGKLGRVSWEGESQCLLSSQREASEDTGGAADQPGGREDGGGAGLTPPLPAHDQARMASTLCQGGWHLRCAGLHARI